MLLKTIQEKMAHAAGNMRKISPPEGCYLVAMFGFKQFSTEEMNSSNTKLFKYPDIFANGREIQHLFAAYKEMARYNTQIEELSEMTRKKKNNRKAHVEQRNLQKKVEQLEKLLQNNLEKAEFIEPQFELRFRRLDMDAIQRVKEHPIIRQIGKTDMSRASIRIVIE